MICSYLIPRIIHDLLLPSILEILCVAFTIVSRALLSLLMSYHVLLLFYVSCLGLQYFKMNAKSFQTHILKSLLSSGWLFDVISIFVQ